MSLFNNTMQNQDVITIDSSSEDDISVQQDENDNISVDEESDVDNEENNDAFDNIDDEVTSGNETDNYWSRTTITPIMPACNFFASIGNEMHCEK